NIRQGTLEGFDEGQGVAIGRRLADQLSLRAGDSVTLVAPRGAVTPMGTTPRIKPYRIAAVFEVGMSEYDTAFVFMPLPEAQAYFNRAGDVTAIEVYVDNPDQVDTHRKLITEAAGRPIFLIDWRQRNATFFNALQVERNVMFLILTIIVIVAAFNISSGLIMVVKDKGRDIGILRTMGVTQGAIMRVFMMTGASVGVVGTVVGFLLALLVCLNIESIRRFLSWMTNTELFSPELYFLSKLPADLDAGETTAVVVMALALSLFATLYPAWRAARPDPGGALRSEGDQDQRREAAGGRSAARRARAADPVPARDRSALSPGRRHARNPPRRRACDLAQSIGCAGGAVRRRQVDAAACCRSARAARRGRSLYRSDGDIRAFRRRAYAHPARRDRLRLSVPPFADGIFRHRERDHPADDPWPLASRSHATRDRSSRLSRAQGATEPSARRAFGRRAAAGCNRTRGRQRAARPARRRAHRKPRPAHLRARVLRTHPA